MSSNLVCFVFSCGFVPKSLSEDTAPPSSRFTYSKSLERRWLSMCPTISSLPSLLLVSFWSVFLCHGTLKVLFLMLNRVNHVLKLLHSQHGIRALAFI